MAVKRLMNPTINLNKPILICLEMKVEKLISQYHQKLLDMTFETQVTCEV